MKTVCEPSNPLEGHMLLDLLKQRGIEARLEGAGLHGAAGELPLAGLVRLRVEEEDYAAARAVIDEWDRTQVVDPIQAPPRRAAGPLSGILIGLVAGAAIGAAAAWAYWQVPIRTDGIDYDRDGVFDERWKYSAGGLLLETEFDRDFDGAVDLVWRYNSFGHPVLAEADDDFDGRFESSGRLRHGQLYLWEVDADGDSVPELRSRFSAGVLSSNEYLDPDTGNPLRIEHFKLGKPVRAEVDSDRDGTMDRYLSYDGFGAVTGDLDPAAGP